MKPQSKDQQGVSVRLKSIELPKQTSGTTPAEVRRIIGEAISQIPDKDLASYFGGQITLVV